MQSKLFQATAMNKWTVVTFRETTYKSRDGRAYFVLGGGGGANKQAQETLACRGFEGNSLPENFEILKLGNATFSILDKISKNEMTDV